MKCCPECGGPTKGALVYGLPGWVCVEHVLPVAGGLGPDVAAMFGFVGALMIYEPGDYWRALWAWLRGAGQ